MKFKTVTDYYAWKIKNLEKAINGTRQDMSKLELSNAPQHQFGAHLAQLNIYQKNLTQTRTLAERMA
ncbi:MAG: hypothetical protein JEZ12_13160 [Desulfobacterium sp.]|nr:hypothetical protein [Desulfobacterium sp.]